MDDFAKFLQEMVSAAPAAPSAVARSFWYYRPEDDFPPRAIRTPDEYAGGGRLSVTGDATGLTPKQQKARAARWCEVLPTLHDVRFLWLHSRAPQALFDAACAMPALEGLYVKSNAIGSLEALARAPALRYLHLGASPKLADAAPIARCTGLRWLELEHLHALVDLAPLAALRSLEGFALAGPETGRYTVASLAPLAAFTQLRWLHLVAVHAADGSLRPLAALANLRWLGIGRFFPWEEFAALAGRLPHARCAWFEPGVVGFVPCPKCRGKRVMLSGHGLRDACPKCDAARWREHESRFLAVRESERVLAAAATT